MSLAINRRRPRYADHPTFSVQVDEGCCRIIKNRGIVYQQVCALGACYHVRAGLGRVVGIND